MFTLTIKNDKNNISYGVLCNGSTNRLGRFSQSSNLCTPTRRGYRISVLP